MDRNLRELPAKGEAVAAKAARTLAQLQDLAEEARVTLNHLRRDIAAAEERLRQGPAEPLVEVNEQLVLAMLHARNEAEEASATLQEVARSAETDALTRLPNRALLLDRLGQAIAIAKRHGTRVAVLFVDLNNFKQINDTFGHAVGDEILKLASHRLAMCVRESDTVSRHGGDEFLILLPTITCESDALAVANKMALSLAVPAWIGTHQLRLKASTGISVYPEDGHDVSALIHHADTAMYRAKREGRHVALFSEPAVFSPGSPSPMSAKPLTHFEIALAEQEALHAHLREANEKLIGVALGAQELQARAERDLRAQAKVLVALVGDLRAPLVPMSRTAAHLRRMPQNELQRMEKTILWQTEYLRRLTDDLLEIARAPTGSWSLRLQRLNLREAMDQTTEICRPPIDAKRQFLRVRITETVEIQGDPVRLVQVFSTLVRNASTHAPEGGIIWFGAKVRDESVEVTVEDNGMGLPPDLPASFVSGSAATSIAVAGDQAGYRLGLGAVQELINAHGGRITASSPGVGRGATFTIVLPLQPPAL